MVVLPAATEHLGLALVIAIVLFAIVVVWGDGGGGE